MHHDKDGL